MSSWAELALFRSDSHQPPELRSPPLPGSSSPSEPRSFLPIPMTTSRRLSPPRSPGIKSATSTPNIRKMAAIAPSTSMLHSPTFVPSPTHFRLGSDSLSTLRDPRSENDLRGAAARDIMPHTDLSLEVAALSNKLISAINHSTNLDDALASVKEELRQTQRRLKDSEIIKAQYDKHITDGLLIRKEEVDERTAELFRKFSVEKRARELADREKRAIESELAELSTKLFEEANQLVATARRETEAAENRTEQVRSQLADTEALLASQQEQLVELKAIMEQSAAQEEYDTAGRSTAPSTPALGQTGFDDGRPLDTPQFGQLDRPDPIPPLQLSHLVSPILRNDIPALEDFRGLLEINRKMASAPPSRVTSGTYSGASVSSSAASTISPQPTGPSNSSAANLGPGASQPHSPSQSTNSTTSASNLYSPTFYPPLRETKFFKRALQEDIEPTMRLDAAPGLSFFARRSVANAIHDATLVLEPLPASSRKMITSCTLCGERRRGDDHARTHRFKAGDESAQWYPLCAYCVGRLRSTCDYINFLRMVRDGFWRCEGEKGGEKAWEESVRLREAMFWARVGGGVVPAAYAEREGLNSRLGSKRPSIDVGKRRSKEFDSSPLKEVHTEIYGPQLTKQHSAGAASEALSLGDEIPEIRELSSTAPPLKVSSTTTSPTNAVHPRTISNGTEISVASAPAETSIAEPLRQSLAASLRRISLRDSLRFGSGSRNASKDRGAPVTPGAESPRLGAVAEMKAVYETKEDVAAEKAPEQKTETPMNQAENTTQDASPGQMERSESSGLNISLPGGFN